MPMTRDEFKNAFREAISSEFSHIPTDEASIDYTFSDRFERKMQKLIRSQSKLSWKFTNTAKKRVAILIAILIALFATACSVKEIREPIVTFFTETYDSFVEYFFEGDTVDEITYEYHLTYVPEGFEQTEAYRSDDSVTITYENASGNFIDFTQMTTSNITHVVDAQKGKVVNTELLGTNVSIYQMDNAYQAMWTKDAYFFTLTCYGPFDVDGIQKIIASVQ